MTNDHAGLLDVIGLIYILTKIKFQLRTTVVSGNDFDKQSNVSTRTERFSSKCQNNSYSRLELDKPIIKHYYLVYLI